MPTYEYIAHDTEKDPAAATRHLTLEKLTEMSTMMRYNFYHSIISLPNQYHVPCLSLSLIRHCRRTCLGVGRAITLLLSGRKVI